MPDPVMLQLSTGRPALTLPLNVVTRRTAILGQTGTGKTSTGVVMVEEAAAAGARFVIIDPTGAWWGMKSSADGDGAGVDCVVMGGHHGDVPLDHTSGALVAELAAHEGYNLVLDLERVGDRMSSWGQRQRFVAEFLSMLYEQAHSQILVVIDEAHRFAPQNVRGGEDDSWAARCLGATNDAVALGRKKGLGVLVITQRLAKLHKDVLELCEVLIAHRLRGNNDLKALRGWIEETDQDVKPILQEIGGLDIGIARVSAPTLGINGIYTIRKKWTFDSSRSIDVGEVAIEPRARSTVDMGALETRMAETLERQREEDPELLHKRIAELERQIADEAPAPIDANVLAEEFHRGWAAGHTDGIERARKLSVFVIERAGDLNAMSEVLRDGVADVQEGLVSAGDAARSVPLGDEGVQTIAAPASPPAGDGQADQKPNGDRRAPSSLPVGGGNAVAAGGAHAQPAASSDGAPPPIKAGARRMIEALLVSPRPLTRAELGTLANVRTGGTMSDYLSALRGNDLIAESNGTVDIASGRAADAMKIVGRRGSIRTPADVIAPHLPKLKAGARRMLEHLMRAHPKGFTRAELSRLANVSTGGTFSDYLSALRRRGLIEERAKRVYASPTIYIWEQAVD